MVGIAVLARPLVDILYGDRWEPAAPVLAVLSLGAAVWPMHVLNLAALSARGLSKLFFRLEAIKKTVTISLAVIAAPHGQLAIAASVTVAGLFGIFVNSWYSGKMLHYGALPQLRDQSSTFILTAISGSSALLVLSAFGNPSGIGISVFAATVFVITYLGGAALFQSRALSDLVMLATELRSISMETTSAGSRSK
jgi:O-antigen/teichoic acid export membrane protein